ncbi:MAG TPA: hypothetical protein VMB71_01385 [Acetobacteraceae bacterium]|nr:hypothetical protein [Acetobacteraceae bacterium]
MQTSGQQDALWQPSTFLERGVAVPFTTPMLAGTRARPATRGVELVVPHPAGVRGVYIVAWSELRNFCAPTVHDVLLSERISALRSVTPRDIRRAARSVAAEGAAGRGARSAAVAADGTDRHERLLANIVLLQMLVEQTTGATPPAAELDKRARAAILELAGRLGRTAAMVTNDIETVADIFAGLGLRPPALPARCERLLGAIERLHAELKSVGASFPVATELAASLIVSSAQVTMELSRRTLAAAQERSADLPKLLAEWAADEARTTESLTRPEWLLDGWEQICLVWQMADETRRRGAIHEMALMVPAIPKEAGEWWNIGVDEREMQRLRRLVLGYEDWRTGSLVIDLVARNESMRAMAA